ncbi:hypothetical protein CPT75_14455 [Butyrivibrio fibrisolvens]|uniref:Transglutaminase-like superfamily protein n=2 Tax=Butyrivibrio fibrisolvens TaxID=831 RepID=A0A317G6R8_BUTFI|nr:hypothetical protein CPT75_14455 [Butyrivibrio fibrisolvens]
MTMSKLYNLVYSFRKAIEAAVIDGCFERKNRMSGFPIGCCDDACDLLGMYLHQKEIDTIKVIGTYRDLIPDHLQNHAWLLMGGEVIIDITGDQFSNRKELLFYSIPVYVGKEDEFHKMFKDRIRLEIFDFERPETFGQKLFMTMYKSILEYL